MNSKHEFTLHLSGVPDLTPEISDALYEAGCDDGMPSKSDGQISIDFIRSAPSMQDAVVSAIRDVERAGIGARVIRFVPDTIGSNAAQNHLASAVNSVLTLQNAIISDPGLYSLVSSILKPPASYTSS